ncbi:Hypothetical protein A7982_10353 [Minicystis rosea]|nr:Hypothetical protein A7982_10353 [Minicystis rosea]
MSGQVSLTAAGTYTKTLTDAPYPNLTTYSGPSLSLNPSATLLFDTPLTTNTLTYAFTLNVPFAKGADGERGPLTYANRLTYAGRYEFSELSNMSLSLMLSQAPLRALSIAVDPSQTQLDPVPGAAAYLVTVGAQESFNHQLSSSLSLMQSNGVSVMNAEDELRGIRSRTISVTNGLNLNRMFDVDTVGLALMVMTSHFTNSLSLDGPSNPPRTQVAGTLAATWSRPLTPSLTCSAQLGLTQVVSPAQETPDGPKPLRFSVQPTGNAMLSYDLDPAVISLSYVHQAAPNLVTSTLNFTDTGTLRFSVPIGVTGLIASGSGGFTHMTPIGTGGTVINTVLGDASLAWRPEVTQSLTVSLRGQVQRQATVDVDNGFTRFSASLSFSYAYPSADAAQVSPPMPPTLGATPYVPGGGETPSLRPYDVPANDTIKP